MNQLATKPDTAETAHALMRNDRQDSAMTPMEMLSSAISNGQSVEVLDKLMALQERWEANQGRKAFDQAIAAAKASIPPIMKNREGHQSKRYADFSAIARVVDPVLSQHGLSYRFRTDQDEKSIIVTCVISHRDGHFEETTLRGPADTSGSKNAIQAIGSSLSYLMRYSLVQALGLAITEDDDGHGGGSAPISDDQFNELRNLIDQAGADTRAFCNHFEIKSLSDLPARQFPQAQHMLCAKVAQKHKQNDKQPKDTKGGDQ